MRKKKKIIILGLCTGFVTFLAVYLGLFSDRGIPIFDISKVYSLRLGENDKISVSRIIVSDLMGEGRKDVLISYDIASYVKQEVEGEIITMLSFKEARILILSSDTTGDFQKLWEYDSGLTRQTAAVSDFDGDGKLDIVVGGFKVGDEEEFLASATSRIGILLQEDGSFVEVFSSNISGFLWPGSIVTHDFDEDGRTDFVVGGLAVASESPYHAYYFHNEGGVNFTMSSVALREGIVVEDMWKADINNDGSLDLLIQTTDLDSGNHSLTSLLNDGRGEFKFRELNVSVDLMIIGDFAEDGYPDIIYTKTDQLGDKVYFLRNDQGEFAEPSPIDIQGGGGWLDAMIAGDFNNDGALDLILLERSAEFREDLGRFETSLIGHLLLTGESTEGELSFTRECSQKFLEEKDLSLEHAAVSADMNDDGWIDLILVSAEGEVYLTLNQHT